MLKGDRKYIVILSICFILLITLQLMTPKTLNWKPSYKKDDKIPYGVSALYSTFPLLFPSKETIVKNVPLYNGLKNENYHHACYIIINKSFNADKLDLIKLLHFVEEGNDAFISATAFSNQFMDSLRFKTDMHLNEVMENDSLLTQNRIKDFSDSIHLNFYNPLLRTKEGYRINGYGGFFFSSFDTSAATVLGSMEQDRVNFIKMRYGKGTFLLHSTPEVFTNYNFLAERNSDYAASVFSYLTPEAVIWDEYYKEGRLINKNPLRVIMSHAPLATAYYVIIFSVLIFILIGIKRKQRIIPVIEPLKNTTLEFVNTIGTLYYQHGSHKEIAEKQIHYFFSYLKSVFRVSISENDESFIGRVAILSGIEHGKVKNILDHISYVKSQSQIHEQELLQLNKMIEDFYKLNKR